MKKNIILFYGINLPNLKHMKKICNLYTTRFMKSRTKREFAEEDYIEYVVEFANVGRMDYIMPIHVPVHRRYTEIFFKTLDDLRCNFSICSENHDHPMGYVDGIAYEGYAYCIEGGGTILFFDHWSTQINAWQFQSHCMNLNGIENYLSRKGIEKYVEIKIINVQMRLRVGL
ncbi:MAG: hypothetical protein ACRCWQ_07625 [Bacilli bacterium]